MEKKLLKSRIVVDALPSDYDSIVDTLRKTAALYIRAIEICDEDLALHRKLCYYHQLVELI